MKFKVSFHISHQIRAIVIIHNNNSNGDGNDNEDDVQLVIIRQLKRYVYKMD